MPSDAYGSLRDFGGNGSEGTGYRDPCVRPLREPEICVHASAHEHQPYCCARYVAVLLHCLSIHTYLVPGTYVVDFAPTYSNVQQC